MCEITNQSMGTNFFMMKKKELKEETIQLYRYEAGKLVTIGPRHSHMDRAITTIRFLQKDSKKSQFVIARYTDKYTSKIVYVTGMDLGSIL